jgi:hypothetical protein
MATSIPKSFRAKIKHPIPLSPPGPAEPAGPAGPGPTPAPINFPHTFSEKLFQVPDGKTWQVLKLIVRNPSQQDPVEFLRVEKASSSGTEQIVLMGVTVQSDGEITLPSVYDLEKYVQNVVLEDQEIIRQVVRLPKKDTRLTMEYELSVIEFTP